MGSGARAQSIELETAEHDGTANVTLKKTGLYVWDTSGLQWVKLAADSSGNISATVTAGDLQIGAVELKDATTTNRAIINSDGSVDFREKPESGSGEALSNVDTSAYAASLVIKASAGKLFTVTGYSSKTSSQFVQLHDASSLPADTAVPKIIFTVPASSNFSFDLSKWGRYFSTGIVVCNSSTGPTKTIGSADCWFSVTYI